MLQTDNQLQREEFYTTNLFPPKAEQFQKWFEQNKERTVQSIIPVSFNNIRFEENSAEIIRQLKKPRFDMNKNE